MEGHSLLLISIPGIVVASLQAGGQTARFPRGMSGLEQGKEEDTLGQIINHR